MINKSYCLVFALVIGVIILASFGCTSKDKETAKDTITIRFSYDYIDQLHPAKLNRKIAERLERDSGGRIKVDVYPAAMLYKSPGAIEALQRGDLEISAIVNAYFLALTDKASIFELPYAFPSRDVLYHVLDNTDIPQKAFEPLEKAGIKVISSMDYSYIDLTCGKRAIKTVDDMKGLKLRAYGPVLGDFFMAAGASPMFITGIEVPTALQQGVVDGAASGPDSFLHQKYYEFQKYLTISNHLHCLINFAVSKTWWDGLPDDIRQLIDTVIKEESSAWREVVVKDEKDCIEQLEKNGMKVTYLSPDEKKRWIKMGEQVWEKHREKIGEDLVQTLESARAKFGY